MGKLKVATRVVWIVCLAASVMFLFLGAIFSAGEIQNSDGTTIDVGFLATPMIVIGVVLIVIAIASFFVSLYAAKIERHGPYRRSNKTLKKLFRIFGPIAMGLGFILFWIGLFPHLKDESAPINVAFFVGIFFFVVGSGMLLFSIFAKETFPPITGEYAERYYEGNRVSFYYPKTDHPFVYDELRSVINELMNEGYDIFVSKKPFRDGIDFYVFVTKNNIKETTYRYKALRGGLLKEVRPDSFYPYDDKFDFVLESRTITGKEKVSKETYRTDQLDSLSNQGRLIYKEKDDGHFMVTKAQRKDVYVFQINGKDLKDLEGNRIERIEEGYNTIKKEPVIESKSYGKVSYFFGPGFFSPDYHQALVHTINNSGVDGFKIKIGTKYVEKPTRLLKSSRPELANDASYTKYRSDGSGNGLEYLAYIYAKLSSGRSMFFINNETDQDQSLLNKYHLTLTFADEGAFLIVEFTNEANASISQDDAYANYLVHVLSHKEELFKSNRVVLTLTLNKKSASSLFNFVSDIENYKKGILEMWDRKPLLSFKQALLDADWKYSYKPTEEKWLKEILDELFNVPTPVVVKQ